MLKGVGYDFKSDIWSLGCLLYELCMLKSPFKSEGLNLMSLFHKIAAGDYQPVSDNYSVELRDLVVAMLANSPENRPEIGVICETANVLYESTKRRMQQQQQHPTDQSQLNEQLDEKQSQAARAQSPAASSVKAPKPSSEDKVTPLLNGKGRRHADDSDNKKDDTLMSDQNGTPNKKEQLASDSKSVNTTQNTHINDSKAQNTKFSQCDGTVEATQTLLNPIITRPKLTEKLLSKPPFRFLHDLIMEVIRATSFAEDLYTESEKDAANITEKQGKIDFLEKMLRYVEQRLNVKLEVRSARIVSGLDADLTNIFLQHLAVAAASAVPKSPSSAGNGAAEIQGIQGQLLRATEHCN